MRLILTRHGETLENREKIHHGHLPGRLSPDGIHQGELLAQRLRDEPIEALYTSDLARAADTTKIIAHYHPGIPVHVVKDLREADLGSHTGKKNVPSYWVSRAPDAETPEQLYDRARNFLDFLIHQHATQTILCVGHVVINKVLVAVIQGLPIEELAIMPAQSNTAVSIFDIAEDGSHHIVLLNCTAHLD